MIILDEQLLGRNLEQLIGVWYRGAVGFITDLRPNSIIKDDAIPSLLQTQDQATFVTINESDFWQTVNINPDFCVVCFAIPDSQVLKIPDLLRFVLQHPRFATKALRMGCVIRISVNTLAFYTFNDRNPQLLHF
jgi:hypothetical protein